MKKESFISDLFGLNQHDAARLLQVSRSQLSMYELGQRDLPLSAKVLLTDLLGQAQQRKSTSKQVMPMVTQQEQQKQKQLEKLLKKNTLQLLKVARQLSKMEHTYTTQIKVLELVVYIKETKSEESFVPAGFLKSLENKAIKKLSEVGLPQIAQLQIKLATLQEEARLLNDALAEKK